MGENTWYGTRLSCRYEKPYIPAQGSRALAQLENHGAERGQRRGGSSLLRQEKIPEAFANPKKTRQSLLTGAVVRAYAITGARDKSHEGEVKLRASNAHDGASPDRARGSLPAARRRIENS